MILPTHTYLAYNKCTVSIGRFAKAIYRFWKYTQNETRRVTLGKAIESIFNPDRFHCFGKGVQLISGCP